MPQPSSALSHLHAGGTPEDFRPAWVELQVPALHANIREIRRRIGASTQLMAVVKANAYGHGLWELAPVLAQNGDIQWFGVAIFSEALTLRRMGVTQPILVLGHTPDHSWQSAAEHRIALTIHDQSQLPLLKRFAAVSTAEARLHVHLKVDTGMHRLGILDRLVPDLLTELRDLAGVVHVEGLFTHFHSAHASRTISAEQQLKRFRRLMATLERSQLRPALCHCANSAATLRLPESHLDLVRVGGALYGLSPDSRNCPLPTALKHVLSWRTQVVQIRELDTGMGLGYDHTFITTRRATVAVLPVGYADGLQWNSSRNRRVLVHERAVPIIGGVCMDQAFVNVTELVENPVRVGDTVTLLGASPTGTGRLWSDEVARQEKTIEYDVTCRISPRIPRLLAH